MMDCVLHKSDERPDWRVMTDRDNLIVIKFREHHFNDTREITFLNETTNLTPIGVAHGIRVMGEWLYANHPEFVF